jgi:hypothetical protein
LQSIKQKLGSTNAYYLKLSTQIVGNALHNIVEEVNAVQNDPQIAFRLQLGLGLDPTSMDKIKSAVREAWKATTIMDDFDLESDFKFHYNENRNTLKSMCNQMGISTYVSRPSASRPIPRSTSSSASRSTAQSRPSSANSGTTNSSTSSSKDNGCLTAIIVYIIASVVIGGIIAAMGGDFVVGFVIAGFIALFIFGNS